MVSRSNKNTNIFYLRKKKEKNLPTSERISWKSIHRMKEGKKYQLQRVRHIKLNELSYIINDSFSCFLRREESRNVAFVLFLFFSIFDLWLAGVILRISLIQTQQNVRIKSPSYVVLRFSHVHYTYDEENPWFQNPGRSLCKAANDGLFQLFLRHVHILCVVAKRVICHPPDQHGTRALYAVTFWNIFLNVLKFLARASTHFSFSLSKRDIYQCQV